MINKTVSLEDSEALLSDLLDVMGDVAALAKAKTVGAVVLAFQIGWEVGTLTQLSMDCSWASARWICSTG